MNARSLLLAAAAAAATSGLAACGDGSTDTSEAKAPAGTTAQAAATRTHYPLTIKGNCGRTVTVDRAPSRVVSVNQGSTEILLSLGLADRMVGTAGWTDRIRPNLAAANASVKRLSDTEVSFERVLDEDPDLVTASFAYGIDGDDPARRDRYTKLGVPTYLSPTHCEGRTSPATDRATTRCR